MQHKARDQTGTRIAAAYARTVGAVPYICPWLSGLYICDLHAGNFPCPLFRTGAFFDYVLATDGRKSWIPGNSREKLS